MDERVDFEYDEKKVVEEAKKRFEECENAHSKNRQAYLDAIKFVQGEQWDDKIKAARRNRPCLTVNRTAPHVRQVVNDFRQNKPSIKVRPAREGTQEVAEIYDGLIRNILQSSNSDTAFETACFTAVAGNQGYWRILTDYCDDTAFEQDIVVQQVLNPLSVWFDPMSKEMDGSDARYVFIEDRMPKEDFEAEYPKADTAGWSLGPDKRGWWDEDTVRVVEYHRVIHKSVTLCLMADGSVKVKDEVQPGEVVVDERPGKRREVQWFKIGGDDVLEARLWPSKWLGVVRVIGDQVDVDGVQQWRGLTHDAMDPQRTYNYFLSTVVEQVTMQPKAPYIGAKGQFEGVEDRWGTANVENHAYLEYEPIDVNGTPMPPPQRQSPPTIPTGAFQTMQQAAEDLQWVTGQHAASFGAKSNEQSGRAILARQQEGDTATYHFLDNMARAIRQTGRVIVDMIPKIYDTPRVLRILGEDGSADSVEIDPNMPAPMYEDPAGNKLVNLNLGRYDVAITVGASYTTKRQESVAAMTDILSANPALFPQIGDIYLRNQDWPGAQAMADRLKKLLPPELQADEKGKDGGIGVMMTQMQQALQEREQALMQAQQMMQQADAEIARLQEEADRAAVELQKAQIDAEAKVQAEAVKAQAQVQVAQIQEGREAVERSMPQNSGEIAEIRSMILALAASKGVEMPEAEEPEQQGQSEEEILAQGLAVMGERIQLGMQQQAEAMAMLAQSMQNKPPVQISLQRGPDGRVIGGVAAQTE
jgi:uncharacterized protein YgiM (DUF1202 family)